MFTRVREREGRVFKSPSAHSRKRRDTKELGLAVFSCPDSVPQSGGGSSPCVDESGGDVELVSERVRVWADDFLGSRIPSGADEESGGFFIDAALHGGRLRLVVAAPGVDEFVGDDAAGLRVGEVVGDPD